MNADYSSLKLQNQLCFPLYLCAKEITHKYTPLLNELDLTYTQYVVMMFLWEFKESNIRDIGKAILLDTNTLTPLLQKLEQKGYIFRQRSELDARETIIKLTKSGLDLRDKALAVPISMRKCINLSQNETEQLGKLLYKLLFNIEGGN